MRFYYLIIEFYRILFITNIFLILVTNKNKQKGIEKLIQIFERYNLNTTKYLDYLDFKKAFIIYKEQNLKIDLVKDAILEFKKNMNKNRVNFLRPTDIEINKY